MHSTALKKRDYTQDNQSSGRIQEVEIASARSKRIAQCAEEACNLPGNNSGPDFEEFALFYGIHQSNFA